MLFRANNLLPKVIGVRFQFFGCYFDFVASAHLTFAEPAPLAGTPPSASRCAPMLSGDAPTIGAASCIYSRDCVHAFLEVNGKCFSPPTTCYPTSHGNRHEWVCGPTTSERSDWRRPGYPEMVVYEGEFQQSPKMAVSVGGISLWALK